MQGEDRTLARTGATGALSSLIRIVSDVPAAFNVAIVDAVVAWISSDTAGDGTLLTDSHGCSRMSFSPGLRSAWTWRHCRIRS